MRMLALSLPILLLSACVSSEDRATDTIADADQVPAARVLGPAQRCLPTSRIQNTRVHGSQVIDFLALGGETWRNTLRAPCPGLAFEQRFAHETSIGELCRTDTVQVLRTGGGGLIPGVRCQLGEFVPVEPVDARRDSTPD
ncbi:hypothetical protein [Croceibacterium ferulae]|uniref:hypothetical protein n=1 Tax=Croceibacterium ferulae TaxID=1854641 RepID=UPI000F890787|nr:hypothetical protein [Croceibacterium ferulae]